LLDRGGGSGGNITGFVYTHLIAFAAVSSTAAPSYSHNPDDLLHVSECANSDRLDFGLDLGSHDQQTQFEGGAEGNRKPTGVPEVMYRSSPECGME
jgi:hypothetical protein